MKWIVCTPFGWSFYNTRAEVNEKIQDIKNAGVELDNIQIIKRDNSDVVNGHGFIEEYILHALVDNHKETLSTLAYDCRRVIDQIDVPLDGDVVDEIAEHIKNWLNLHEGNITEEEYELY